MSLKYSGEQGSIFSGFSINHGVWCKNRYLCLLNFQLLVRKGLSQPQSSVYRWLGYLSVVQLSLVALQQIYSFLMAKQSKKTAKVEETPISNER